MISAATAMILFLAATTSLASSDASLTPLQDHESMQLAQVLWQKLEDVRVLPRTQRDAALDGLVMNDHVAMAAFGTAILKSRATMEKVGPPQYHLRLWMEHPQVMTNSAVINRTPSRGGEIITQQVSFADAEIPVDQERIVVGLTILWVHSPDQHWQGLEAVACTKVRAKPEAP